MVLCFTAVGISIFSRNIMDFLKTSDYFTVKEIWYESSLRFMESNEMTGLKGRNIFDVDLTRVEKQLRMRYPQFAQLRVLKRFPNQILVVARQRTPLAQTQLGAKMIMLDDKGVILSIESELDNQFPFIVGTGSFKGRVATGILIENVDIQLALKIIKFFKADKILSMYRISRMDVSNLSQISFYILGDVKIMMDQENFYHQLKMLSLVLSQAKLDADTVKYIDLRFKEPILRKK